VSDVNIVSARTWRPRVVCADTIARLALQQSGGHVAATRVLHDGLFRCGPDASGGAYPSPDRSVLVVTVEHEGRQLGVAAFADRSGRVFSDDEVTLAERATGASTEAEVVVERLLELLGGETAALYRIDDDGAQLALVAAR